MGEDRFPAGPPKSVYFLCNSVSQKKSQNKQGLELHDTNILFRTFFSHVNIIFFLSSDPLKRVRARTECAIGEEQCGFRQSRGCMDQVFAVRQVCEKYLANGKDVFWAFMDLEKPHDTLDRQGMWQMLRVYGVGGKLLKAVQSFYVVGHVSGWEM